jgi:hypothetical protein
MFEPPSKWFELDFASTSLGRNRIKYKLLGGLVLLFCYYGTMPTISECQQLICSVLLTTEDDIDYFMHPYPIDPDDDNIPELVLSSDDSNSASVKGTLAPPNDS